MVPRTRTAFAALTPTPKRASPYFFSDEHAVISSAQRQGAPGYVEECGPQVSKDQLEQCGAAASAEAQECRAAEALRQEATRSQPQGREKGKNKFWA